jgi:glycerol-3-phosphate cytidylyltransferase
MKPYKIGYTTGTFDLFHVGHLNILKNAKQLCDILIVGVTSDEKVIKQKNKKPIISENDRIEIVSSIKYVDIALLHIDNNKFEAYKKYKFDVVFIGDDYLDYPEYKELEEQSLEKLGKKIDVIYIPYTKRISTTKITKEIFNC